MAQTQTINPERFRSKPVRVSVWNHETERTLFEDGFDDWAEAVDVVRSYQTDAATTVTISNNRFAG
jgi:hypothetical protein